MKVFVFGYNRYTTMSTSTLLESGGVDHVVLVHTPDAASQFIEGGTALPHRIHITGQPKGLANNRNAALALMEPDEWAMFLVDDLKSVTEIRDYSEHHTRLGITIQNQRAYKGMFDSPVSPELFLARAQELTETCDRVGARLGGFCGISNPLFRDAKFKFNTLADGRAWVVKKGDLRFDPHAQMIDDVAFTALNIQKVGVTVVNNWILPECKRYTGGGYGSIQDRLPQKLREAAYLAKAYPNQIRIASKAGWPAGSHVQLRRTLTGPQLRYLEAMVDGTVN